MSDARESNPSTRDAAWVDREYGREKWPAVRNRIDAALAGGERSLARLVSSVARWEWERPGPAPIDAVAFGAPVRLPAVVAYNGLYGAVAEAVIAACREDTRAVIDLGCGWGRSLFEVWLRGGPREATYHAMEFTQAGLDCVSALAALEPAMRVNTARFDFQKPDFSSMPRDLAHAVVFTVSSVHQVPVVEKAAYRAFFGIAGSIDCLHFEQIGWQMPEGAQRGADRDYALRNHYNRNLWSVLGELSEAGELELIEVRPDFFGTQAVYPLSLAHWRRAGA